MSLLKRHATIDIDRNKDGNLNIQVCLANADVNYNVQHNFKNVNPQDPDVSLEAARLSERMYQAVKHSIYLLKQNQSIGIINVELNLDL